jgi:hypothetical protein
MARIVRANLVVAVVMLVGLGEDRSEVALVCCSGERLGQRRGICCPVGPQRGARSLLDEVADQGQVGSPGGVVL